MTAIGSSNAMEDMKIIVGDVAEEHNGVYNGKWNIISPEGFSLRTLTRKARRGRIGISEE